MEKVQSLADYLGLNLLPAEPEPDLTTLEGDAETICQAVLASVEFRQYVVKGLVLGSIPSAVMIRIMDMAGWRKPEQIEHTGKDGQPLMRDMSDLTVEQLEARAIALAQMAKQLRMSKESSDSCEEGSPVH